ncbi:MAG: hypothetical protein M1169_09780 [Firmicutes bacterium]|nr:hypothetical protein [Bacillota bacterium]
MNTIQGSRSIMMQGSQLGAAGKTPVTAGDAQAAGGSNPAEPNWQPAPPMSQQQVDHYAKELAPFRMPGWDQAATQMYNLRVYHNSRLQTVGTDSQGNIDAYVISGTVDAGFPPHFEPDGDMHFNVKLDPQYPADLINSKNVQSENGELVCEIVHAGPATQGDAEPSGQGYVNQVTLPKPGQHVYLVGPYALDKDHGWMECHPVLYVGSTPPPANPPASLLQSIQGTSGFNSAKMTVKTGG